MYFHPVQQIIKTETSYTGLRAWYCQDCSFLTALGNHFFPWLFQTLEATLSPRVMGLVVVGILPRKQTNRFWQNTSWAISCCMWSVTPGKQGVQVSHTRCWLPGSLCVHKSASLEKGPEMETLSHQAPAEGKVDCELWPGRAVPEPHHPWWQRGKLKLAE